LRIGKAKFVAETGRAWDTVWVEFGRVIIIVGQF
jgi:hypothetical protein